MEKKLAIFFIITFLIFTCVGCNKTNETEQNQGTDYKPMIFIKEALYGDTGKFIDVLPNNWKHIGDIKTVVSQSEPMVKEEFYSNTLTVGDALYSSDSVFGKIYVKISSNKFLLYEIMQE